MKHKYTIAVLLICCFGKTAFSQSDSLIKLVLMRPIVPSLDLVVIYEKRYPLTFSSLWKQDIEKGYTGQEMPAVLAKTPSMTWYSDGGGFTGYSYMRLRGMDQTRINVTLNGVPLNEPEDQGAYFSNYPDFLKSISHIQVYRGVGTTTNGTTSFAGSIALESPSMRDTAYTEISASAGSFRTHRLSAEFNSGLLKNSWSFYGRFSTAASDGFREHSGTDGQSFFFSGMHAGKKGDFSFTGFTGISKNEMAYLAEADTLLRKNYRANSLTTNEKDEFKQSMLMMQYAYRLRAGILTASLYYNYLQGGYDILFAPDLYNFSVKSDFGGAIVNYAYNRNNFKLNTGLHANAYKRSHYSFIQPDESSLLYKNAGRKNEFAAFAKASYDLRKFSFFADLQYRHVDFTYLADPNAGVSIPPVNWNFINPKAGASYSLGRGNIVYVSVGKTSREPTRNDLFAGYDNLDSLTYAEVGSFSRVKPESMIDFEAGIKFNYRKMKLAFNVYDMEFKNEIAAIGQLSYIGLPLRKNVASSYRRGIELSLNYSLLDQRLNLNTQANLSTNRIKEYTTDYDSITHRNVQPLLTPQAIINQSVEYTFAPWISAGVSGRFVSQSFLDNTENDNFTIPSSFILNASVSLNFKRKYSVELMANNLTGQKYYSSGYVQGGQPYYFAMATRNYFVTFKLRF